MLFRSIIEISRRIWNNLNDNTKYNIGAKFGVYRVNGDTARKERVNKYLETVGGLNYKDDDSIVSELIDLLNQLRSVHFSFYNFYNEYCYARDIEKLIPKTGIPNAIKKLLVKTICVCYAGNGKGYLEGVDENAVAIYERIIERFSNEEIKYLILLFSDSEFTVEFFKSKPDRRIRQLCQKLLDKTNNEDLKVGLQLIINYPRLDLKNLHFSQDYQNLLAKIN